MPAESAGGGEFAQLMAYHVFRHIDRNVLAAVMHRDGVADEFGEDGGGTGPGLENLLFAGLVQLFDALIQLGSYERALLYLY